MRARRAWALAAGTALAAVGLTGCSPAVSDGRTVVTYWMWDANQVPGYQLCAADFEEANPDVTISIEQYGWDDYWTQLTARMVAESAPDVFVDHTSQFGKYVTLDQILDIEERVAAEGIDLDQYQEGLTGLWAGPEGGLYGLPKDWDTVGLFYNVDMLADAGYTAEDLWTLEWNPTDGGTFEQFLARMSIDRNGVRGDEEGFDPQHVAVYGIGYNESGGGYGQVQWSAYALSNGWEYANRNPWGTEWSYDDPALVETIDWWRSLITKGYMPSLAIATSGVGTIESIGAGAYGTLVEGSWNSRAFVELQGVDIQVAPTPIGPSGHRASVMNGLSDAIWSGTPHPNESFAWVEYLASPACQSVVAEQGRVFPAIATASDTAVGVFQDLGIDAEAFAVHLEDRTAVTGPVSDRWPELQTIMQPTMDAIVAFRAEPSSLGPANARVNALFTGE